MYKFLVINIIYVATISCQLMYIKVGFNAYRQNFTDILWCKCNKFITSLSFRKTSGPTPVSKLKWVSLFWEITELLPYTLVSPTLVSGSHSLSVSCQLTEILAGIPNIFTSPTLLKHRAITTHPQPRNQTQLRDQTQPYKQHPNYQSHHNPRSHNHTSSHLTITPHSGNIVEWA